MREILMGIVVTAALVLGAWTLLGASDRAAANSCSAACHAAHNQCRIAQKGSPACDTQLTQCLKGCAGKK